jgi:hypothetical protein
MLPKMGGPTRTGVGRVAWTGLLLASGACRDGDVPMLPTPINRVQAAAESVTDSTDFFAADVTIVATGESGARGAAEQRREFRYHVERKLQGKAWKTTMTMGPNGFGAALQGQADISRVEIDEGAETASMYRRDGTAVPMPDTDHPAVASMARRYGSDSTLNQLRALRAQKHAAVRAGNPHAWLDGFVVPTGDEQRGRRLGRLERHFGKAKGKIGALDRYAKVEQGRTVELLVDPGSGNVTESNVAQDGRLLQHARYEYAEAKGRGVYVRQSAHVEIAPPDASRQPTVIDYTLSNVRLERRGGIP